MRVGCRDAAMRENKRRRPVLNRLERFNEALECYEMALRAQESRQV